MGITSATVDLKSEHRTLLVLVVRSDRSNIEICAPILARTPLLVPGSVPDTLWAASWGPVPSGKDPPIC